MNIYFYRVFICLLFSRDFYYDSLGVALLSVVDRVLDL